jgi:hypothetical protein
MRTVTLIGRSKKGKERVKQWGSVWAVEQVPGLTPQPERLLVVSMNPQGSWRWVHPTDDPDFELV